MKIVAVFYNVYFVFTVQFNWNYQQTLLSSICTKIFYYLGFKPIFVVILFDFFVYICSETGLILTKLGGGSGRNDLVELSKIL